MSAINFPDPSQSPWTNSSTGITYTYSNGVWKALSSEETFLKQADADLTYLKQDDGGTQQVISGGGGLNVDGDVQKKGNTVPSAVMGATAPSNPGICDFWTDTSGDDPVLKSWNGTEWVEVGSSGVATSELPSLPSQLESTDLLVIERGGVQYRIPSDDLVPATGAIHTPVEVLTPFDGAGVGGDKTYTPMSNTISAVSQAQRTSQLTGYYDYASNMPGLAYGNGYYISIENGYRYNDRYKSLKYWDTNYHGDTLSVNRTLVRDTFEENWSQLPALAYGLGVWVAFGRQSGSSSGFCFWREGNPGASWNRIGENNSNFSVQYSNHSYHQHTASGTFTGIHFANNRFVVVGDLENTSTAQSGYYLQQHMISYSNDGKNWSTNTTPRGRWSAVTYGDKWVVTGVDGSQTRIVYSTDGITWTAASAPHQGYGDVAYGDGRYVAVGNWNGSENTANCFATSTDGINWTSVNAIPGRWTEIEYGNGMFVAMNQGHGSYGNHIAYSTDGLNWTAIPGITDPVAGSSRSPGALLYAGGRFVATIQGYWFVSEDGINWDTNKVGVTFINDEVLDNADSSVVAGATLSGVLPNSTQVEADSNAGITGQVFEITSDTSMTLHNTSGTWAPGMKVVSQSTVNSYAPSPAQITFTSENAGTTAVSATGTTLLSRTWTLETRASDSDPWTVQVEYEDFSIASSQDGATEWTNNKPTLLPNTQYRVKVAYNALGARTQESPYHTFTTGDF